MPFGITNAGVGDASGNANVLPFLDASGDCSGATCGPTLVNIYGAYMNIFDIDANFGNTCGSTYLPAGTFAFRLKDCAFHLALSMGIYIGGEAGELLRGRKTCSVAAIDNARGDTVLDGDRGRRMVVAGLPVTFLLYLMVCWFHGLGIYPARPPTTIDNYLSNFAQNTPLRIYRSKY